MSIGNLGGFAGPYTIGLVRGLSDGLAAPLADLRCTLWFGAALMVVFGRLVRREAVPAALTA